MSTFRAAIRVQPGARIAAVGGPAPTPSGRAGDSPALLVRVRARPVEGAATAAAERAVAEALGVPARRVRVVRGQTTRDKLIEVTDPPEDIRQRWARLLAEGPPGR